MRSQVTLIVAMGCFCVACLLVGLVRVFALRSGVVDVPNARSSHVVPTPRGGGIAIAAVTLIVVLFDWSLDRTLDWDPLAWIIGGGMVAAVGFLDDLRGLPAITRFGCHVVAAILLLFAAGGMPPLPFPSGPVSLGPLGWVLGVIAIVWSTNLFNFMDGIDGLAAMQCVFVAGAGWVLAGAAGNVGSAQLLLLALSTSTAGFLVWNFPPAKIFMGDVGSGFIGFALAAGAILSASHGELMNLWTWVVLNGLFCADATVTLLSRLAQGRRIYEAHRLHVYQRWSRRLGSHRKVVIIYSAINVFWCLPWAVATMKTPAMGPAMAAAALVPLFAVALVAGAGRQDA